MGKLDPAIGKVSQLGLGLSGALISAMHRRGVGKPRRTPDHLLIADSSGLPGPALVEPIADFDAVLLPSEVDRSQAKDLALEAGKTALDGIFGRLMEAVRQIPRTGVGVPRVRAAAGGRGDGEDEAAAPPSSVEAAGQAAWDRFLAAYARVAKLRAAYARRPDDLAAEHLRRAEADLEDAVAIAGEFEVNDIRWILA